MLKKIKIFWKLGFILIISVLLMLVVLDYIDNLIFETAAHGDWDDSFFLRNLRPIAIISIVIVLSFAASGLFVILFVKRPTRKLVDGMNRLADKEFEYRLAEDERDEFGSLASSFNDMASMLYSSMNELKKNRDYLEGILESSADIIITVNASGKIQTINTGAENALGYGRMELIGKPIETLFADPEHRKAAIEKLQYKDNVLNYETQFKSKGGELLDVLLTLSRFRNPSGDVIGTLGISKDITEEKRLQKKLLQSERLATIGQVFTGIQHSMKNMLNALKGGSYMVKIGLAKDNHKMLVEGWEIVQQGINRLTKMSMDMLKYVKEWKPRLGQADIKETLTEIYDLIKQTAKDKGVEFRLKIDNGLPTVYCDSRMIHSSVMDIVSNALDACLWKDYGDGEIPEVTIGAYIDNGNRESIIEIKDNGIGMTDEIKANIFDPFFSTKSKAGTGLGLAITSRMIEVHGGKIDVESEPNIGTMFRIVLPIDGTKRSKE